MNLGLVWVLDVGTGFIHWGMGAKEKQGSIQYL